MFSTVLKIVSLYFMKQHATQTKQHVTMFADHAADYAETRVLFIKNNLSQDLERMTNSFIGLMIMFAGILFSGMMALLWLFAIAWESADRVLILACFILIPILLSVIVFFVISSMWKNKPLMDTSIALIARDWQVIRGGLQTNHTEC
jgi:hypothetical protein